MNERITCAGDVERLALKYGILPFFRCGISSFSIEEMTADELWFSDTEDGPWEWKGPVIAMGSVAYGKFFNGKAGFVSLELLPDFINYRRNTRKPVPAVMPELKAIHAAIEEHESLLSNELKRLCGYTAPKRERLSPLEKAYLKSNHVKTGGSCKSHFEALMRELQMALCVVIADFEYGYTRDGKRYGWGRARYTTPELMYGSDLRHATCSPEESLQRLLSRLSASLSPQFPAATPASILRLLR
jgi:hypothetical protein